MEVSRYLLLDLFVGLHVAFWVGWERLACVGIGFGVAWIVSWAGEVEELFPERFLPEIFWHPSSCHVFEDVNFSICRLGRRGLVHHLLLVIGCSARHRNFWCRHLLAGGLGNERGFGLFDTSHKVSRGRRGSCTHRVEWWLPCGGTEVAEPSKVWSFKLLGVSKIFLFL